MAGAVGDEVVALFTAIGRWDRLEAAVAARFGSEVDALAVAPGLPAELVADLQRIPTRFAGFAAGW